MLMPKPRSCVPGPGTLPLGKGVILHPGPAAPTRDALGLEHWQGRLDAVLGRGEPPYPLMLEARSSNAGGAEAFVLELAPERGRLQAGSAAGLRQGLARALQWLLAPGPVRSVVIEDEPALPWRGLLLDPARHPLGEGALHRTLDAMATLGMNVLHLHLSDDQGVAFESRRRPKLHKASGREGYLSFDALHRLGEAAAQRGLRIVPELDLPGHAGGLLFAYPECAAGAVPAQLPRAFGPSLYALDPTREESWALIDDLLDDLAECFPDPYLHLGGDEVPASVYAFEDQRRVAWCAERGLAPGPEVQQWFSRALAERCAQRGKRLILWDEALHPALPREVTVQVWRRVETLEAALAQGHDALLSAPYYLDLALPAARHLAFSPGAGANALAATQDTLLAAPELADVQPGPARVMALADGVETVPGPVRGQLLGGEACLWGELVDDAVLDGRLHDRLPAVAEALWCEAPPAPEDHRARLGAFLPLLSRTTACEPLPGARACCALGLDPRHAGALRTFYAALVPLRWYKRLLGQGLDGRLRGAVAVPRPRDARTPLTTPVDFLPAENLVLHALAAKPAHDSAWVAQGRAWRAALKELAPALAEGGSLAVFAPHGEALAALASALVAGDPELPALAERYVTLEAGEARFALPAALLGRPLP
ncbi:MAG: family 20 glycosylhydrolase [Pseudomonadales bacterium]